MQPLRSVIWARPAWLTGLTLPVAVSLALLAPGTAYANAGLARVSHDIYTDTQAQHDTEAEPDVYAPAQLAGPMKLSWLPNTSQGRMFGDYIATAVLAGGNAYPVLPVSRAPAGATFHQAMDVPTGGLAVTGGTHAAVAGPTFGGPAQRPTATTPPTAH